MAIKLKPARSFFPCRRRAKTAGARRLQLCCHDLTIVIGFALFALQQPAYAARYMTMHHGQPVVAISQGRLPVNSLYFPSSQGTSAIASSVRGGCPASTINIVYIGDSITYGVLLKQRDTEAPPATATEWLHRSMPKSTLFFSNQGHSGHTTVDFLPSTGTDLPAAEMAAKNMLALHPGALIFSVMLGTNDSAESGPNGAPVTGSEYAANLTVIFKKLLHQFPGSIIVVQRPTWYSPNTHNSSDYERRGLNRLQTYFPAINATVHEFARTNPNHVYRGDTNAFAYFSAHYRKEMQAQPGVNGAFYLHPNAAGAKVLGRYWGLAIKRAIYAGCVSR